MTKKSIISSVIGITGIKRFLPSSPEIERYMVNDGKITSFETEERREAFNQMAEELGFVQYQSSSSDEIVYMLIMNQGSTVYEFVLYPDAELTQEDVVENVQGRLPDAFGDRYSDADIQEKQQDFMSVSTKEGLITGLEMFFTRGVSPPW